MVEAQGLSDIPKAHVCPLPQVMGVNSSGDSAVDGWGAPAASAAQAQSLLGSILLINAGSGTRLWFLSLVAGVGMEAG